MSLRRDTHDTVPSVLQLLGPSAGGIRRHVAELARRLPDHGWVVSVMGPPQVMHDLLPEQLSVEVPPFWKVRAFRPAAQHVEATVASMDVLHVHGLKAMKRASAIENRPPTVMTVHNLVAGTQARILRPMLQLLERNVVRETDHLIVISDEISDHFADVVPTERTSFMLPASPRRAVERPATEVRASYGIEPDAPLVAVVARHHRQKNLRMFLEALTVVRRSVPAVRALLVGDGPERSDLERHARTLDLESVVVFAGERANPADEMGAADVVALSSDWEGSPLVVAECLQLAKPLVCTAVGSVTANLVDGRDARITPIGDAERFAETLIEVLQDRESACTLAANGAEVAARLFDPARLVAEVAAVYDQVRRHTPR